MHPQPAHYEAGESDRPQRTETRIPESEELFRSVFLASATGIAISTPAGRYLQANAAYCGMLGYTEEELRERDFASLTHPDDLHLNLRLRDEVAAGRSSSFVMEKRYLKKNGETLWTRLSVSAARAAGGEITVLFVVAEDITERKRAEAELQRQQAELRVLLDLVPASLWLKDAHHRIIRLNRRAAEGIGQPVGEIEGKFTREIYPEEVAAAYDASAQAVIDSGLPQLGVVKTWHNREGQVRWIQKDTVPLFDENRKVTGVIVMAQDVTERKQLEEQFLRAQRMEGIGQLAGGIAHDLNNILAPIMMSVDLLKSVTDPTRVQRTLATIEVSARRGADLVKQVLSFARGLTAERIEVQPRDLLHDLETIVRDTFPRDIRLHFSAPEHPWMILADPTQIHQILLNLCINARDAMPHGGSLTVSAANCAHDREGSATEPAGRPGRYVAIAVADTGVGMSAQVLQRIFEPFFTTKGRSGGTGLGLSTVQAIAKSHGGAVRVDSEPGRGTTFTVLLPAVEDASDAGRPPGEVQPGRRGRGETILVVDDEASILTIVGQTLQSFGYRVLTAADGAAAITLYADRRQSIDLVLTDLMMPVMDGAALIHALKHLNPKVRIVASTGLSSNGPLAGIDPASVDRVLIKPYTADTLLNTLRAIFDGAEGT
jgi:PAS domain S-box-containing protein